MNINFLEIITYATIVCGIIWLADVIYFAKRRKALFAGLNTTLKARKPSPIIALARFLFPVLLIVFLIRAFLFQIYTVPTGSLEPTIIPGDDIIASMFSYGLHLPIFDYTILKTSEPKVGDIVLFHYPVNPKIDYIKRLVGIPGDKISYINKELYINGKPQHQTFLRTVTTTDAVGQKIKLIEKQEDLNGIKHDIYLNPVMPAHNFYNLVIPKGKYFFMGDNRDNSLDSRFWGFVPQQNIIAAADFVIFSWNKKTDAVRWDRIGTSL